MKGILITKGVTPGFPAGTFKIIFDENTLTGKIDATLHLHLNVIGLWLRLSLDAFRLAKASWKSAKAQLELNPDDVPIDLLEQDFQKSMVAIVASTIAMEAFYARVSQLSPIQKSTNHGHKRKASRYAQVSEQFRHNFTLKENIFIPLRKSLKQLYELRNLAIHPTGKLTPAVLYPELDRGVEYRFEKFRAKNIANVIQDLLNILFYLSKEGTPKTQLLSDFCIELNAELNTVMNDYPDVFKRIA